MAESGVPVHRNGRMYRLEGALNLVCSRDRQGRTYLSRQAFNVPFHLSKPYWTGETLLIQVVNPTAGVFSTDRLSSRIELEPRTAAALTAPSACRVHVASSGCAELRQELVIRAGAWLDYAPAMLIPQEGARLRQRTRVEFEKGGAGMYLELLAPGRVASGESLAFEFLALESDVFYDGHLMLRERYRLSPGDSSILGLQRPIENAFVASGFVVSEGLGDPREISMVLREECNEALWIGLSPLEDYFWTVRLLASGSVPLRRGVRALRSVLADKGLRLEGCLGQRV